MLAFAIRDLREHTGELVKNAENLQCSIVSKHGKPLFIALPFDDALLASGAAISLADKLLKSGELSIAAAAKLDRKSTRLNSSHRNTSRMPSSA